MLWCSRSASFFRRRSHFKAPDIELHFTWITLSRHQRFKNPANHTGAVQPRPPRDPGGFITVSAGSLTPALSALLHLPSPFSHPSLSFLSLICRADGCERGSPASPPQSSPAEWRSRWNEKEKNKKKRKSARLSGGVFPQRLLESLQRAALRNQVRMRRDRRGRLVPAALLADPRRRRGPEVGTWNDRAQPPSAEEPISGAAPLLCFAWLQQVVTQFNSRADKHLVDSLGCVWREVALQGSEICVELLAKL